MMIETVNGLTGIGAALGTPPIVAAISLATRSSVLGISLSAIPTRYIPEKGTSPVSH
jgi:hypothetical protein